MITDHPIYPPRSGFGLGIPPDYSKSRRLGFREGSLDKNPKINKPTKKRTTMLTMIFRVTIVLLLPGESVFDWVMQFALFSHHILIWALV